MHKNRLFKLVGSVCFILLLILPLLIVACAKPAPAPAPAPKPAPAPAAPIELKVTHHHPPPGAFQVAVMGPWAKKIEEASNGRLKLTVSPAGTYFAPPDTYQGVIDGLADIALGYYGFTPGRFPTLEVIDLPGAPWVVDGPVASITVQKLWESGMLAQYFKEVKVLWLFSNSNPARFGLTKPVRTVEDFKGLTIRGGSETVGKTIESLGATPVLMSTADLYVALQRGTIAGTVLPHEGQVAFKAHEIAKYVNTQPVYLSTFFVAMNLKKFESLPADLKKIIEDNSGMVATEFTAKAQEPYDAKAVEAMKAAGVQFIDFSPQEKEKYQKIVSGVWDWWLERMKAKGINGKEVLDAATRFANEAKAKK